MVRSQPNFALILSDDHASSAISAYGSKINETPRIDELARTGVRFDNFFVTNSLCSPSRASILTGTYSHVNGVTTLVTPIDASQPTFVSLLREAGYRTAIVGKWHMGEGEGHDPQSFDYWDVLIDQGEYFDPQFLSAGGLRIEHGYTTDLITDLALSWLDSVDDNTPWCLLIYHKAPHRPCEPSPAYMDRYLEPIPVPETFDDDLATRSASVHRAAMRIADHLAEEDLKASPPADLSYDELALWKYQRYMQDYLRCVASVDDNVGRVIDYLAARGQRANTVLIYASDQGFFLGDHGWFDKRLMFEQSLRMPVVLSYPERVTAEQHHAALITNVDFAQTILEFAGVDPHPRMQGYSFAAGITGGEPPSRDAMYYRYWENDDANHKAPAHYGIRTLHHKLIYYYNDGMGLPGTSRYTYPPEWELYDLDQDPHELNNVIADPAYEGIRERLATRLRQLQLSLGDSPHPNEGL